jgi:glycosyltransferase involved in cell wall biosynthesis
LFVDSQEFFPLSDRPTLRKKWLGPGFEKKFIIGAINANNTRKRWDLLFHAFGRFATKHTDVMLLIKIDTSKPETPQQYDFGQLIPQVCQAYSINPSRIKLHEGKLSGSDLNEIYNCCDLGLTTTSGEGWGLIPCEMSLCKVPSLLFLKYFLNRLD